MAWTMANTNGFTELELVTLNEAQDAIEQAHPEIDGKNISDSLNNVWNPGMTTAELIAACQF